ncbi:MAG: GGDEF domain-containing protein [Solirubrobacteraceae bacterium]
MPNREQSGGGAPVAPVAAIAAAVAALVAALGGGDAVWLCLPPALLAADRSAEPTGAGIAAAVVIAAAVAAGLAVSGVGEGPSPALVALVGAGCVAVAATTRRRLHGEHGRLRELALNDPMTGIANRRSLLLRADYELARHRRARMRFALVMIDLDGFKALNDRFGHAAGDDLLRDVAGALRQAMRAQDTVARLGGDEFCVLAPETDERGSARLTAKVLTAVRDVSAGIDSVSGSVGVAIFPEDGATAAALMQAADERLLEAKRERYRGRRRRAA